MVLVFTSSFFMHVAILRAVTDQKCYFGVELCVPVHSYCVSSGCEQTCVGALTMGCQPLMDTVLQNIL